jgi:hypothetical protein
MRARSEACTSFRDDRSSDERMRLVCVESASCGAQRADRSRASGSLEVMGQVVAEKPQTKKHLDEVVHVVATIIHQAKRGELDGGEVQYTLKADADARLMQRLDALYGRE